MQDRRYPIRHLGAMALAAGLLLPHAWADTAQGIYLGDSGPGKWRNGTLPGRNTPAGRPAGITDQQVTDAITAAFAAWSSVCNVVPSYGGTTSSSVSDQSSNQVVVGFADIGTADGADAQPYSNDVASGHAYYTGAAIKLNTNAAINPATTLTDGRELLHEVGHALGLGHSDDPYSLMYANPYTDFTALTGDDIETCANLYGGKGMQTLTDDSQLAPDGSLSVVAEIDASQPSSTPGGSSLGTVNAKGEAYFSLYWHNVSTTSTITYRYVAPNGMAYLQVSGTAVYANGFNTVTLSSLNLPYNGLWQFQGLVDGKLAASTAFTVQNASTAAPAKLEYAAIVEQTSAGAASARTVDYSAVGMDYAHVYANDAYAQAASSFSVTNGSNHAEFWAKSSLPRYTLGSQGTQSATSADAVKQVLFNAANGVLSGEGLDVSETGSQMAYTAHANVQAAGSGTVGVYVAALLDGQLFFRHSTGWDLGATPLFSFNAPGAASLDVIRGLDIRLVPPGSALFVGYGSSLNDVVMNNKYKVVRAF